MSNYHLSILFIPWLGLLTIGASHADWPQFRGPRAASVDDPSVLFIASEQGDVHVVPVTNRFSVVATNRMDETIKASPALSGGNLLVRTRSQLVSVGSGN